MVRHTIHKDRVEEEETTIQLLHAKAGLARIIGESPAFLTEKEKVEHVAQYDVNVLILGETGTGKEVFARAIHYLSRRAQRPFVAVNCGAIPVDLVENELFGHERGAFTGATSPRLGIIHESNRGTLFLDEIDSLPSLAQVKLLRFLQEKEYRALGSAKVQHADVRVIAATNVEVEKALQDGRLRQDLYHRLNVVPLLLPPLRARREDIPLLARHFLRKYAEQFDKSLTDFSEAAMERLLHYEWPGNVRELEHVVERAVVLCRQRVLQEEDFLLPMMRPPLGRSSFHDAKTQTISQFEIAYVQELLAIHQGNITKAAAAAQKDRRSFWQLLRKHDIQASRFHSSDDETHTGDAPR